MNVRLASYLTSILLALLSSGCAGPRPAPQAAPRDAESEPARPQLLSDTERQIETEAREFLLDGMRRGEEVEHAREIDGIGSFQYSQAARRALAAGEIDVAVFAAKRAVLADPVSAQAYEARAEVARGLGEIDQARRDEKIAEEIIEVRRQLKEPLNAALREHFERFVEFEPEVVDELVLTLEEMSFRWVLLNEDPLIFEGERYDGFRFRVPHDEVDLLWAFTPPEGRFMWYIVPRQGLMTGFRSYENVEGEIEVEGERQPVAVVVQGLTHEDLVPGAEYAIWFKLQTEEPTPLLVSLNFGPSGVEED